MTELERLISVSCNKNPPLWEQKHEWSLKVVSLNCQSLSDKIVELKEDPIIIMADMICLTETWLKTDTASEGLTIPGLDLHLNSIGDGKGIATYYKPEYVSEVIDIKKQKVQLTKLFTSEVDVVNVYRSQGADNSELAKDIKSIINKDKLTIICGDFNQCFLDQRNNPITRMLEGYGFKQLVDEATHIKGGLIDHVYSNHNSNFQVDVMMYSPYYTSRDHDALCIIIRR